MASFNAWVRYFVWNFKGNFWNSTQNILPIHWKMRFLYNIEILRALKFKSSSVFLKRPPGHNLYGVVHHCRCRHGGHYRYCCSRCCREPWQLLFLPLPWLRKQRTWLQLSQAQGKSQMITSVFFNVYLSKNFWQILELLVNSGALMIIKITSSNRNIFRVTGHLFGELTGHQWIPHTKASDAELWYFFYQRLNKRLSKQSWGWWFETPSRSLWRHCNTKDFFSI